MSKKRVHILTAVNAANISKVGGVFTIKDVCGAVNDIVMNGRLYPADQLAAGVKSLENKPAPAGHPKNSAGQHISAANGEALVSAWIGSFCKNARHEGGRTLVDVVVNEKQARAHPIGEKLVERLDSAIAGTNIEPIHVSTGVMLEEVKANGESLGKKYSSIATNLQYDHLAILLDEQGAGTPGEGIGMFLNSAGQPEEVEEAELVVNDAPADLRTESWVKKCLKRLLGNSDMSFEQITDQLRLLLPDDAYPREVFDNHLIWADYKLDKLWRQDYSLSSTGSVAFTSDPVEVVRKVQYEPITTNRKDDPVKDKILAALNAAGITTAGLDEPQLLAAYNSLVIKPLEDKLLAANSKVADLEKEKSTAQNAERDALAVKLATNSSLTADDFKAMPLARLKELEVKAAPVVVGNTSNQPASEFAGYDLNKL